MTFTVTFSGIVCWSMGQKGSSTFISLMEMTFDRWYGIFRMGYVHKDGTEADLLFSTTLPSGVPLLSFLLMETYL